MSEDLIYIDARNWTPEDHELASGLRDKGILKRTRIFFAPG
ncbi:MAG: hypothetical protein WDO69_04295 [Pseudomonadota bacterium]